MAKKRKKRVSKAKKKATNRTPLIKLGLIIFVAVTLWVAYLYHELDSEVSDRLAAITQDRVPAVYSEPIRLDTQTKLSAQSLKDVLVNHRYREVAKAKSSGEFSIVDSGLNIRSRAFRLADGNSVESTSLNFNGDSGAITNASGDPGTLLIEPEVISTLGSGEMRASNRKSLNEIPLIMRKAVIAIEDERFYSHHGIDFYGVARAAVKNIIALRIVEGGSTITQQLAKNLLLTPKRTFGRKLRELLAAISLERRLTKDQILELYLNEVYLGQEGDIAIHGVAEAAMTFFGKPLDELDSADAAMLAGIIKAPSGYSPRKSLDRAIQRRNTVLEKMHEQGIITDSQLKIAKASKPNIIQKTLHSRTAPHFVAALQHDLAESVDLDDGVPPTLSVYTGLDGSMQRCAEQAVQHGLDAIDAAHPKIQKHAQPLEGALVSIDPMSGKIRAWVGSRDFSRNQFDHVNMGKRQIGSTIKPFLYLTALDGNLNQYKVATPVSVLSDEPLKVDLVTKKSWIPENYDRKFHGDVSLRYALEHSLNIPAALIGQKVGIPALARTARLFHLSDNVPEVPSLALGAADTTLLQLTAGYAALANGGIYVTPRLFISAWDDDTLLARSKINEEKIVDPPSVFVLTSILEGVINSGTGHPVREHGFTAPAAGKTGTSNDTRDAWFVAFTPDLATGVWVGFDDNTPIGLTGGAAAAPIWAEYMKCVAPYHGASDFKPPDGVVFKRIDRESGELATGSCRSSEIFDEVFVEGTEPTRTCHLHGGGEVVEEEHTPVAPRTRERTRSMWETIFGSDGKP